MLSIFLVVAGYGISALAFWRYSAVQQKKFKIGGIFSAIVATSLLIATVVKAI